MRHIGVMNRVMRRMVVTEVVVAMDRRLLRLRMRRERSRQRCGEYKRYSRQSFHVALRA